MSYSDKKYQKLINELKTKLDNSMTTIDSSVLIRGVTYEYFMDLVKEYKNVIDYIDLYLWIDLDHIVQVRE